jgi:zinc protease
MRNKLNRWWCALILCLIAAPAWALLPIQHWQTKQGARVYFVEARNLPMFDVSVDFPAGSAYDTREKSGVAGMTQGMLKLGAGGLSEDEIARRMADSGAQFGGRVDSDRAGVTLRTLSHAEERRQALDVFARVLQRPEFPAAVLDREKKRLVEAIKESDTKPETLLSRGFNQLAYANHPYGLRGSGEAATVAQITRDDLVEFYRRYYTVDRAVVAIIGDLTRADAEAIAEQVTGQLPRSTVAPVIPPVPSLAQAETRVIPHPASQSHLLMGMPGIKRDDPDYFPLFVGNYILGGGGLSVAHHRGSALQARARLFGVQLFRADAGARAVRHRPADAQGPGGGSARRSCARRSRIFWPRARRRTNCAARNRIWSAGFLCASTTIARSWIT